MVEAIKPGAVQSMQNSEEWRRDSFLKGDLDPFNSLPRSNDVSATMASNDVTERNAKLNDLSADQDFPLVDAALEATMRRELEIGDIPTGDEVAAIRAETERLKESVTLIANASVRAAKAETYARIAALKGHIRRKPIFALGLVAALGFVLGISR